MTWRKAAIFYTAPFAVPMNAARLTPMQVRIAWGIIQQTMTEGEILPRVQ